MDDKPKRDHRTLAPEGKVYQCAYTTNHDTQCKYCNKDRDQVIKHAKKTHTLRNPTKPWKDIIDTVYEDAGKQLLGEYNCERKGSASAQGQPTTPSQLSTEMAGNEDMEADGVQELYDEEDIAAAEALLQLKYGTDWKLRSGM